MSKKKKGTKKTLKNLSLGEVNSQLMSISNQIEEKMKQLQDQYNFSLDYSFKPITLEELKKSKS